MRLLHLFRTLPVCLLLLATFQVAAQSNISLDSLSKATQDQISRICLPVQFREGAGAYRNCVQAELHLRGSGSTSQLGTLSFDDKYAVQQACAKAGGQSSSNYKLCVTDQISALDEVRQPKLDKLSEDELYVVQQSCFDAQSNQGAANYRKCLNQEVDSLLSIPAVDTSSLNMVKKNALQLRCSSNSSNAVQYRQCVGAEFESIVGTAPVFLPVSTATRISNNAEPASQSAVIDTVKKVAEQQSQNANNVAAAITATASNATNTGSKPTMALPRNISPPRNNTAVEQATAQSDGVATASEALALQSSESGTNTLRDITGDTITTTTPPANTVVDTSEARVISRPDLVETIELQERAKAQGIEPAQSTGDEAAATAGPAASNTPIAQQLATWWQKFLDTLVSLEGKSWLIIAAVLALPALLMGLFSLTRAAKKADRPSSIRQNPPLAERIEPGMQTRKLRHEQEAAALFDDNAAPDHDAVTRIATKPTPAPQERAPLVPPPAAAPAATEAPASANVQSVQNLAVGQTPAQQADQLFGDSAFDTAPAAAPQATVNDWQSGFGPWLEQQPAPNRMAFCIEFLIYWVAYGDERYPPDLKKRLFTSTDLSSHDLIKRWVLKQDVFAFADVVSWLRNNASQKQLDQSMTLIMSLLITEHSVTPVQNTLLRFLADAFNIGKNNLEMRFEKAFGHPLPPIARPDKYQWWAKQDPQTMQRWDSRSMANKPETEQMIARLGLQQGFDEVQVINAFRRAARRCHPDRFTELGEHERALAEQQYIKFEQARDKLLGVSV